MKSLYDSELKILFQWLEDNKIKYNFYIGSYDLKVLNCSSPYCPLIITIFKN